MDLANLFRLIRRQRLVVGVLGTLGVAAVIWLYVSTPVTYRASGSVVLLKPTAAAPPATTPGGTVPVTAAPSDNPYVSLNDMSVVLDIVSRRMKTPTVRDRLAEQGVDTYTLGANLDFYRGPILDYSADGRYEEDALRGAAVVRAEVQRQLDELQAQQGVAPADLIRLDDAVTPTGTTTIITSKVRIMMAAIALVALAVLGVALLLDARRRSRENAAADAGTDRAPGLPVAPTFQVATTTDWPAPAANPTSPASPTPAASSSTSTAPLAEFEAPSYWSAQR